MERFNTQLTTGFSRQGALGDHKGIPEVSVSGLLLRNLLQVTTLGKPFDYYIYPLITIHTHFGNLIQIPEPQPRLNTTNKRHSSESKTFYSSPWKASPKN